MFPAPVLGAGAAAPRPLLPPPPVGAAWVWVSRGCECHVGALWVWVPRGRPWVLRGCCMGARGCRAPVPGQRARLRHVLPSPPRARSQGFRQPPRGPRVSVGRPRASRGGGGGRAWGTRWLPAGWPWVTRPPAPRPECQDQTVVEPSCLVLD